MRKGNCITSHISLITTTIGTYDAQSRKYPKCILISKIRRFVRRICMPYDLFALLGELNLNIYYGILNIVILEAVAKFAAHKHDIKVFYRKNLYCIENV